MERLVVSPRENFGKKLESIGLSFHGWDNYWNESACYRFSATEVDLLEAVTQELHQMCKTAVAHVINENRFEQFQIPREFWEPIRASFKNDDFSLYGRFDLAYDGKSAPKMLEYNADTPTSLLESAVAQWYWMEEKQPDDDQFNSLHERLVERWKPFLKTHDVLYFASLKDNEEDWVCVTYLMDTAKQANPAIDVRHIYIEDIAWNKETNSFLDLEGRPIAAVFKLYPWEWMMREDFGKHIISSGTRFVEPLWKSVLSCKALLPILWELYPDHPNLLPAYFSPEKLSSYAKKPLYSREGANIELVDSGKVIASDEGPYGGEGFIYQALHKLPDFSGKFPVIGSWIVGDDAAGMCMREDSLLVTTNMSNFVPHYFYKD